jgi:hypothetical protein
MEMRISLISLATRGTQVYKFQNLKAGSLEIALGAVVFKVFQKLLKKKMGARGRT